jgi:cell wall-associated NlpC family hydrolase
MPGSAVARRGDAPTPSPAVSGVHSDSTPPAATGDGYAVAGTALALRGSPYRNGGADPSGFDCSGFIQYVFAQHGIALPRDLREQFRVGMPVKPEVLEAGDVVFFSTTAPGPSHVAIAIGGDQFVHAPSSKGVVRVERLSSSYWSPRFLAARRITN